MELADTGLIMTENTSINSTPAEVEWKTVANFFILRSFLAQVSAAITRCIYGDIISENY